MPVSEARSTSIAVLGRPKHSAMAQKLTVLISPTFRCNMKCAYCYVRDRNVGDMSLIDFETSFRWIVKYCKRIGARSVEIVWFGGEPLLFDRLTIISALRLEERIFTDAGLRFVNRLQSNLTLISEEVCELIHQYFNGSVSGSVEPWGASRRYPGGKSAFPDIEEGLLVLRRQKVRVGLVCTLTKKDIVSPERLYQWFKSRCSAFRVNRAHPPRPGFRSEYLSVDEYDDYIMKLFQLYVSDPSPSARLVNFVAVARSILLRQPLGCADAHSPWSRFEIAGGAKIFSYCRKSTRLIGDCHSSSVEDVLSSLSLISREIHEPHECETCIWKERKVCVGGCIGESDKSCVNSECGYRTEYTRAMYEYVYDYLEAKGVSSIDDCERIIPKIS